MIWARCISFSFNNEENPRSSKWACVRILCCRIVLLESCLQSLLVVSNLYFSTKSVNTYLHLLFDMTFEIGSLNETDLATKAMILTPNEQFHLWASPKYVIHWGMGCTPSPSPLQPPVLELRGFLHLFSMVAVVWCVQRLLLWFDVVLK